MEPQWSNCDDATLGYYASYLDSLLQAVDVPYAALSDSSLDRTQLSAIDNFYEDIIGCMNKAVADVIPCRKRPIS